MYSFLRELQSKTFLTGSQFINKKDIYGTYSAIFLDIYPQIMESLKAKRKKKLNLNYRRLLASFSFLERGTLPFLHQVFPTMEAVKVLKLKALLMQSVGILEAPRKSHKYVQNITPKFLNKRDFEKSPEIQKTTLIFYFTHKGKRKNDKNY